MMTIASMEKAELRLVSVHELDQIRALYHSVIGSEGCTWNEEYPGEIEISTDFRNENLFCLDIDGSAVAAVSVVSENELDDLNCWYLLNHTAEIARVVVAPEYQHCGAAEKMLSLLFPLLCRRGYSEIHLLVAKVNTRAAALYRRLGFHFAGETFCYGNDYFCCERSLRS